MLMRRRQSGFNLLELLTVVAVLAIVVSLGAPSLQLWFVSKRVMMKAEAVLNGLQLARAEAVRRNARVYFTLNADTSWTVGCVTAVGDNDGDGVADCPSTIQSKPADEGGQVDSLSLLPPGATTATFSGVGALTVNADASAALQNVTITKSGGGETSTLQVLITVGGQSRICDPEIDTAGDPKKC
jgi:type IV fimbrial biogenesis protein FimT